MEIEKKLQILADAAKFDASCASSGSNRERMDGGIGNGASCGICHSFTPDGRCVSLLKILLTNYCIYDCAYCVNRISSDTPRARFTPDEVVSLTIEFYKRNYIEGLFLSSGVMDSPDRTMEELVLVARKLRIEHRFGGYIHLKGVPGASAELLKQAGAWADRISVNIELPSAPDLVKLAPGKTHTEIETGMAQIRDAVLESKEKKQTFASSGQSTQMVIGATPSSDGEILSKASQLYSDYNLKRVYYSAFSPIPHAASVLPVAEAPLVREHRLYQADWLMRFYGFENEELTASPDGNLPLDIDPKLDWALRHREFFPVDVNRADRVALLRVTGLGVRNVDRILKIRKYRALTLADLRTLRVPVSRARNFLITAEKPASPDRLDSVKLRSFVAPAQQMSLFEARTGEF